MSCVQLLADAEPPEYLTDCVGKIDRAGDRQSASAGKKVLLLLGLPRPVAKKCNAGIGAARGRCEGRTLTAGQ